MPPRRRVPPRSPELGALGDALRELRIDAGLTQEQLADEAGTDLTQVGGIERGARNPTYTTMVKLATALGTQAGTIASLADSMHDRG